jgi:hypothetical protein
MRKSKKTKDRSKMNMRPILIISSILVIMSSFLIINSFSDRAFEVKYFDVEYIVGGNMGFDVNTSALKFGKIPPGGSSTRTINIENQYDFPLHGKVYASKNLAELLSAPDSFLVEPMNRTEISISINIPRDYKYGNYTGRLKIELRR